MDDVEIWEGWLDRKGTSMITPWTKKYVVLMMNSVIYYNDEGKQIYKGELAMDETSRVVYVDQVFLSSYKFCIITSQGMLQLSAPSVEERNQWIQKILFVTKSKSEMGQFIAKVDADTDYTFVREWEESIIAHSIDESSGLLTAAAAANSANATGANDKEGKSETEKETETFTPLKENAKFASFVPFDAWQDIFEPSVRKNREEQQRVNELIRQGKLTPADPQQQSSYDKMRDYVADTVVSRIANASTEKCMRLLLEGSCQLIAAAERQLARNYHLAVEKAAAAGEGGDAADTSTQGETVAGTVLIIKEGEVQVPLSVQEDLLSALGALRALMLTFRFEQPGTNDTQIIYLRRLAINRLQCSLSRVMDTLEALSKQAGAALDQLADGAKDLETKVEGTLEQMASRKGALASLKAILKPLLSRDFLNIEAAPLLKDFMQSNTVRSINMQGLAAEVNSVFGDVVEKFVKEKVKEVEGKIINQLEIFIHVIEEFRTSKPVLIPVLPDLPPTPPPSTAADANSSNNNNEDGNSSNDDPHYEPLLKMHTPAGDVEIPSSDEVLLKLAKEKRKWEKRIEAMKDAGCPMWGGTDRSIIEMILLEETTEVWKRLQDGVHKTISTGVYTVLELCGAGNLSGGLPAAGGGGDGDGEGSGGGGSAAGEHAGGESAGSKGYFY